MTSRLGSAVNFAGGGGIPEGRRGAGRAPLSWGCSHTERAARLRASASAGPKATRSGGDASARATCAHASATCATASVPVSDPWTAMPGKETAALAVPNVPRPALRPDAARGVLARSSARWSKERATLGPYPGTVPPKTRTTLVRLDAARSRSVARLTGLKWSAASTTSTRPRLTRADVTARRHWLRWPAVK